MPIPVAVRSKAWIFGRSLTRIVGSDPTGDMDVCLLWVVCCYLVEASAMRRSRVQRSPTDCCVSLSVIKRKLQTSTLKRETGIGRRGRLKKTPLILIIGTRWRWVVSVTSRPRYRYRCRPESVWTFWRRYKSLYLPEIEIRLLSCQARSQVTIPTELFQLLNKLMLTFLTVEVIDTTAQSESD
jgi:hypothetical protein